MQSEERSEYEDGSYVEYNTEIWAREEADDGWFFEWMGQDELD